VNILVIPCRFLLAGNRPDVNLNFYGRNIPPEELLSGAVDPPVAGSPLYEALDLIY